MGELEAKMRVLVTGASGMTGRAVCRVLRKDPTNEVMGLAYSRLGDGLTKCDLRDAAAVETLFSEFFKEDDVFNAVVHCAAERRPDVCEKDAEYTQQMNVDVPRHLASLCNTAGYRLIHTRLATSPTLFRPMV